MQILPYKCDSLVWRYSDYSLFCNINLHELLIINWQHGCTCQKSISSIDVTYMIDIDVAWFGDFNVSTMRIFSLALNLRGTLTAAWVNSPVCLQAVLCRQCGAPQLTTASKDYTTTTFLLTTLWTMKHGRFMTKKIWYGAESKNQPRY